MDFKTYQQETLKKVNTFDRSFKPWKKWQDVKLSALCPCNTCDVHKELVTRQYEVQMSGGLQEELMQPCEDCLDVKLWEMECVQKLAWYEANDERLKGETK